MRGQDDVGQARTADRRPGRVARWRGRRAPRRRPGRPASASARACSSMWPPRETLTTMSPGLTPASASREMSGGAPGRVARRTRRSRRTSRTARRGRPAAGQDRPRRSTNGSKAIVRKPNARALAATSRPIRPAPAIPSVWPRSRRMRAGDGPVVSASPRRPSPSRTAGAGAVRRAAGPARGPRPRRCSSPGRCGRGCRPPRPPARPPCPCRCCSTGSRRLVPGRRRGRRRGGRSR